MIDKDRYIYDKEMPHIAFDVEYIEKGDKINVLIVDDSKLKQ